MIHVYMYVVYIYYIHILYRYTYIIIYTIYYIHTIIIYYDIYRSISFLLLAFYGLILAFCAEVIGRDHPLSEVKQGWKDSFYKGQLEISEGFT